MKVFQNRDALVHFIESGLLSALITALVAAWPVLTLPNGTPDWANVKVIFIGTFLLTCLMTLRKYGAAVNDQALVVGADVAAQAVSAKTGVPANVTPIQPPAWLTGDAKAETQQLATQPRIATVPTVMGPVPTSTVSLSYSDILTQPPPGGVAGLQKQP